MKIIVHYVITGTILLALFPWQASGASCPPNMQKVINDVYICGGNIQMSCCADTEKFMGEEQSILWSLRNNSDSEFEVTFTKHYTLSCGKHIRIKADVPIKPHEFMGGGNFSGYLDLGSAVFPNDDCGAKGNRVTYVQADDIRCEDLTYNAIKNKQEGEKKDQETQAFMEKQKQEKLKKEQEQKQQEAINLSGREQQEKIIQEQRRMDREEAERRQREKQKAEELRQRAEASRERTENARRYQDRAVADATSFASNAQEKSEVNRLTSCFRLGMGLGGMAIPLYLDHSGSSTGNYSDVSSAGGMGYSMEMEYWPLYSPLWGVGFVGNYVMGVFGSSDSTTDSSSSAYGYGMKLYAGPPGFAGVLQFGNVGLLASSDSDYASYGVDSKSTGSADYSVKRLGYGVRIGSINDTSLEVLMNTDSLDDGRSAVVYSASLDLNSFRISFDYSGKYPVDGKPAYPLSGGLTPSQATSQYWKFMMTFFLINDAK